MGFAEGIAKLDFNFVSCRLRLGFDQSYVRYVIMNDEVLLTPGLENFEKYSQILIKMI